MRIYGRICACVFKYMYSIYHCTNVCPKTPVTLCFSLFVSPRSPSPLSTDIHTHTYIYIHIHTYICIQVGFAHKGNEDELLKHYDAVVPDDGPMHTLTQIVEELMRMNQQPELSTLSLSLATTAAA